MSGKQALLHVINSLPIGGAEVLLKNSIAMLPEYRHVVAYLNKPDTLKPQFPSDVEVVCLNHSSWSHSFDTIRKLRRLIKANHPALVHSHLFEATLLTRFAVPSNVPLVFTIHNILSEDAFKVNQLSLKAERLTYKKRHYLIAVSQAALDDYDKWIGVKGKASVLYNYVDQSFFDGSFNYAREVDNPFTLVAVGNLKRQKNYGCLVEAFALLKDLPVTLDIYGSGALSETLAQQIANLEVRVTLKGSVTNIAEVLPRYHAYIMASLFEGFGIAPMEAMALGMPLLLSDLDVFKEIAGRIPVYFDPTKPEDIARAIRYAYNNWNEVKQRSMPGKEHVRTIASKAVYRANLLSIYSNV